MSFHAVTRAVPALLHVEKDANNGLNPGASVLARVAHAFNYICATQTRAIMARCQPLNAVGASGAAGTSWSPYFRTGPNQTSVDVLLGLVRTNAAATSPYAECKITRLSDSVVMADSKVYFNGRTTTSSVVPDDVVHKSVTLTGLSPNIEYKLDLTYNDGIRIAYAMAMGTLGRHVDDTVAGACDPSPFLTHAPIYAADLQDLIDSANELWRHAGTHHPCFQPDYGDSVAPVISSTTYVDVLSAAPRIYLPLDNHTTEMRTTVPCTLAVKGRNVTGTGTLDVRLFDGTNSLALTGIAVADSDKWKTVAVAPAATTVAWRVQAKVSSGSWRVIGVHLEEYEA
jgi:hypothetical protein